MSTQAECTACGCELLYPRVLWVVTVMDPNSSERGPFDTFLVETPIMATAQDAINAAKLDCQVRDEEALGAGLLDSADDFWDTADPDLYWDAVHIMSTIRLNPEE